METNTPPLPKNILILLDVHGILAHGRTPRPHIKEFILALSKKYLIAIYSSAFRKNIDVIITKIFENDIPPHFEFILDRSYTEFDPDYVELGIPNYSTVKKLEYITNNPIFNPERKYSFENMLLIDHDPHKTRFISNVNVLLLPEYTGTSTSIGTEYITEYLSAIENKIARFF